MPHQMQGSKFRSLPAQVIPLNGSVVLRRGMVQITIDGEQAQEVIEKIAKICDQGASFGEILAQFREDDHPSLISLLEFLVARNFLVSCGGDPVFPIETEQPSDIFYWHFDPHIEPLFSRIRTTRIAIVGVNGLGQEICSALNRSGFGDIRVIDHPDLCDPRISNQLNISGNHPIAFEQWERCPGWSSTDCVVVASDIGPCDQLRWWNQNCVERKGHFLPVILDNIIGYLGPLVIPGETACYECLIGRENSQMHNAKIRRALEHHAPKSREVTGYHQTTCSVLANLAVFELVRFFGGMFPGPQAGTVLEVNLLTSTLKRRKVLKVPRCVCCSSMNSQPSLSPYKDIVIADV